MLPRGTCVINSISFVFVFFYDKSAYPVSLGGLPKADNDFNQEILLQRLLLLSFT